MAFESKHNRGKARQLNLNEMYNARVSSRLSIQSSQQTPGFEQSNFFPQNMDSESKTQSSKDVGNDGFEKILERIYRKSSVKL